ncbi:MAG: aspartate-semialdehyde dehydrogenase [Bacteroidetes bacterium]|nr:aspartate-semialdehyde dehydrogenase [Bacteroidota bacterium]
MRYTVAVVGASGLVGRMMIKVLQERSFPVGELRLLASERSAGASLSFWGEDYPVREVVADAFENVDIALFSAGSTAARRWAPVAVEHGAVVIDNSSAFRMELDVPLIVPEVNPHALQDARPRIIANPNCSTIQMVITLKPLQKRYGLRRIVVCTYQAVSGAGQKGVDQLEDELQGRLPRTRAFPHAIAGNAIPQIAQFEEDGFTVEERKMIHETRKILEDESIGVSPTCVRIPVMHAHSEAVHAELRTPFEIDDVRALLADCPGIVLIDDPDATAYPLATMAAGSDEVYVGRIRRDPSVEHGIALWVVSDNLRKGAATNAVQIAELWRTIRER